MAIIPSITFWNRLEPRPRSNNFGPSLAAQVRDPAWFLCRQWQTGEFAGQDAGSPAFITIATTASQMTSFTTGGAATTIDPKKPLERQALAEPFSPADLSISVEIGQTFAALLVGQVTSPSAVYQTFVANLPLEPPAPATPDFNPLDADTAGFLTVCAVQTLDGAAVYAAAKAQAVPSFVATADRPGVAAAFGKLVTWVQSVWGDLGDADPPAWAPNRLEYQLQVQAEAPDGTGVVLNAFPDEGGELPWSSFDVSPATIGPPSGAATQASRTTLIPGHVRFRSLASQRFWDFESSQMALPDVKPEPRDVSKTLTLDFLLIHGVDWFIAPMVQFLGQLTRVDALVVTDVFGGLTSISRADAANTAPGPARWTLFSTATPTGLANYYLSSPTAGAAARSGRPIESVRFARDEMANMAWGIQNAAPSPIGRPRPGPARSAAVDALGGVLPPTSTDTTSPLRYQVETEVPIHWTPLLGVSSGSQINQLAVAAMLRPTANHTDGTQQFAPVEPIGRILNPNPNPNPGPGGTYQIQDNEVPRAGLVVERVAFRSRWTDGSTHLWLARRRRTGAGETASGLRFDVAQPANT